MRGLSLSERVRQGGGSSLSSLWALLTTEAKKLGRVDLCQGYPNFPGCEAARKAAAEAVLGDWVHAQYSPQAGTPQLREAIADLYRRDRQLPDLDQNSVVVTTSGTEGIMAIAAAVLDAGDEVVCMEPAFPWYAPCVRLAGGSVVPIPLQEEGGFRVPIPQLREALRRPSVKMLITNSPHNPTGAVMTRTEAEEVARLCRESDVWLLSEEVYDEAVFTQGGEHVCWRHSRKCGSARSCSAAPASSCGSPGGAWAGSCALPRLSRPSAPSTATQLSAHPPLSRRASRRPSSRGLP